MLREEYAILSYIVYINYNQYAIEAVIWESVAILEKFINWYYSRKVNKQINKWKSKLNS